MTPSVEPALPAEPALRHLYSGKVRELYETGDGVLLLVATDRIWTATARSRRLCCPNPWSSAPVIRTYVRMSITGQRWR